MILFNILVFVISTCNYYIQLWFCREKILNNLTFNKSFFIAKNYFVRL